MDGQLVFSSDLQIKDDLQYKIEKSIDRLKAFEPPEGYYLAFSGGKDSQVIYHLAEMAEVKFDAHYNITTVDPPELLKHIKQYYPGVQRHKPDLTMWALIPKRLMPPTRVVRYCCSELKEKGGERRFVVTGVRWSESSRRKNSRQVIEFDINGSQSKNAKKNRELFLMNDNEEKRKMIETCSIKGKHILNPIIEWTDQDVWNFIKSNNIPYCNLYDEGFERLGCVGCPLAKRSSILREFERYPTIKAKYVKAFEEMIQARKDKGLDVEWKTGQEVMDWWLK